MDKDKFLIVGSNSFSGAHCVKEALNCGYEVMGISRSKQPSSVFLPYKWNKNKEIIDGLNKFIFKKLDLNTNLDEILQSIDYFRPTHIINFVAQGMVSESWLNPTDWYKTNVVSQVAFHDEIRKRDFLKKYVHVTTPEVYGSTDEGWINEMRSFSPSTPYAVSRAACDMHLKSFFEAYNFPVIFTRAANVYGPGQQLYRIIPRTILSALSGREMNLHGGGLSIRSFIHIKDVIRGTLKLAKDAEPGTTWHLSTKNPISIKDLVKKIFELCNVDSCNIVKVSGERLGKDQSYLLDSSLIRDKFDWNDQIDLITGIKETIEWVEKNFDVLCKLDWEYKHKK